MHSSHVLCEGESEIGLQTRYRRLRKIQEKKSHFALILTKLTFVSLVDFDANKVG